MTKGVPATHISRSLAVDGVHLELYILKTARRQPQSDLFTLMLMRFLDAFRLRQWEWWSLTWRGTVGASY